jgi:hypothetical protein
MCDFNNLIYDDGEIREVNISLERAIELLTENATYMDGDSFSDYLDQHYAASEVYNKIVYGETYGFSIQDLNEEWYENLAESIKSELEDWGGYNNVIYLPSNYD